MDIKVLENIAREIGEDVANTGKVFEPSRFSCYSCWSDCIGGLGYPVAIEMAREGFREATIRREIQG